MSTLERPETLTSAVTNHIRDAIVRGEYPPGSQLPEIRLAEDLGTSRGTVRESLRVLSGLGLVEILPHRGCFVSQVNVERAEDIYELRIMLEPEAVRQAVAAPDFRDTALPRVEKYFAELQAAVENGDTFKAIAAERSFHRETWKACRNQILKEYLLRLEEQTRRLLIYSGIHSGLKDEVSTHQPILKALRGGRGEDAAQIVSAHIAESRDRVLAKIAADPLPVS